MADLVIVGGGPTGVELAGTLKEMAQLSLHGSSDASAQTAPRVILVEAGPSILTNFGSGCPRRQ